MGSYHQSDTLDRRYRMLSSKITSLCTTRLGQVTLSRLLSSSSQRSADVRAGYLKIKEKQKRFNVDNGLRVHQKGGFTDELLYKISLGLVLIGAVEWCRVTYTLAFPEK